MGPRGDKDSFLDQLVVRITLSRGNKSLFGPLTIQLVLSLELQPLEK